MANNKQVIFHCANTYSNKWLLRKWRLFHNLITDLHYLLHTSNPRYLSESVIFHFLVTLMDSIIFFSLLLSSSSSLRKQTPVVALVSFHFSLALSCRLLRLAIVYTFKECCLFVCAVLLLHFDWVFFFLSFYLIVLFFFCFLFFAFWKVKQRMCAELKN